MSRRKEKKSSGGKIFLIILVLVVIGAGAYLGWKYAKDGYIFKTAETSGEQSKETEVKEVKKLKIVNEDSKSRPYAVMINNNHAAWPLCGIQDAYLAYEIVTEGGITRIMALYKDQETAKIGSIRSARHYFIDYAEENDAIYIHWGGSPQAYNRIRSSDIDDLDGMALEGSVFFRDRSLDRDYEHTGFTSIKNLNEYVVDDTDYSRPTTKDLLLKYSVDEITLDKQEGAKSAQTIDIKYSSYHSTSYEYDEANKVYLRSMSDEPDVDLETGKQLTVKNIIVYDVSNYSLNDGSGKDRQELENLGSGEGYYITEGYAVPITWEKTAHSSQTVYKYLNGQEITVNDGNTFIQIYPTTTGKLTITPKPEPEPATTNTIGNTVSE